MAPELTDRVDEMVGVLVWNDHIHPYAEPVVAGWVAEQLETFGRRFELMHIDRLVRYVRDQSLQVALRTALRAEGLLQ